jgi:hypothetical protein
LAKKAPESGLIAINFLSRLNRLNPFEHLTAHTDGTGKAAETVRRLFAQISLN